MAPVGSGTSCPDPPGFPCTPPNAGTITFSDGTDPGSNLSVSNRPTGVDGIYPPFSYGVGVFPAGDVVTVTASGGEVPPFRGDLVAPRCPTLLSPPAPDAGSSLPPTYAVPTSQDFVVAWDGGETGATVHLLLEGSPGHDHTLEVDCAFDGAAGKGSVPQAVLAMLRPTPEGAGWFTIYQERSIPIQAGSFQVTYVIRDIAEGDPSFSPSPCDYNWGFATFQ